jgi:hypothetical protein
MEMHGVKAGGSTELVPIIRIGSQYQYYLYWACVSLERTVFN